MTTETKSRTRAQIILDTADKLAQKQIVQECHARAQTAFDRADGYQTSAMPIGDVIASYITAAYFYSECANQSTRRDDCARYNLMARKSREHAREYAERVANHDMVMLAVGGAK